MIQIILKILILSILLLTVNAENVVEYLESCDEDLNTVDRAKIFFKLPSNIQYDNIDLFATNSLCFRCSKTLVAIGLNSTSNYSCASLWTPFSWKLYLINGSFSDPENEDAVISSMEYTFGENGEYHISSSSDYQITLNETKEPDDPLEPLWILIGCIIFITFISFLIPILYRKWKRRTSLNEAPNENLEPLIIDKEIEIEKKDEKFQKKNETKQSKRLGSLDSFRGLSLLLMIFVNYGGGGYWFFDHMPWNGLTFADLLFPWFMWIMGVSMALSFSNLLKNRIQISDQDIPSAQDPLWLGGVPRRIWIHIIRRSIILFLLGMFLANGYDYQTWRVPGVLQYFGVSYFITSSTILVFYSKTQSLLSDQNNKIEAELNALHTFRKEDSDHPPGYGSSSIKRVIIDYLIRSKIYLCYRYEIFVQLLIMSLYLIITFGIRAPGCPLGYIGPGGISDHGDYDGCTGGIHRYIDMKAFGYNFIFHHPTCLDLYQCSVYDPEGLVGALNACLLTYLGLMAGRVLIHSKDHLRRISRWLIWSSILLLLAGILCGFSRERGIIPINKNLWSTSFVFVSAGSGLVGLSLFYYLIDWVKLWSGAPFIYLGMNSILIYFFHGVFQGYMPFSYIVYDVNHGSLLQTNVLGVFSWAMIAYYFYKIRFFVKI